MTEERNHATIRDYARTFRRRKFVILGIAAVAVLAALALSLTQSKTYTAQASLAALDESQSAGYADLLQANQTLPQETSAQLAQTATRPEVLSRIKSTLKLPDSIDTIRSKLSVSQDQQSNFVLMSADASTASGAAALANAAANAAAYVSNKTVRDHFAGIAAQDNQAAASLLAPFAGKKYGQLPPQLQARFQASSSEANQLEQLAAKLEAFSKAVTVAQVTSPASVPSSPSSPHPVTNAILGGLVGLVVGLLVAWFLESVDRRLRRPDETESVVGLPVVGAVTTGLLGQVPGRGEAAASLSAFRMVRTNVRFLAPGDGAPPRSILVTSALSGEGKTTVALGLALSAAASGLRTLLIEADVHRPVHARRLGLSRGPGLADYMTRGLTPTDVLQVYTFVDPTLEPSVNGDSSNGNAVSLTCLTAGNVSSFLATELGTEKFAKVISEVSEVYDHVVIDTGPLLAVPETLEMVTFVDSVAFCVRLGRTTVEQARAARESLTRLPARPMGLVLTDIQPDVSEYYGYAYAYEHRPVATR